MSDIEVVVLGVAQDGGVPQLGCRCARCVEAHENPAKRRYAAALGLIDRTAGRSWLVEATPQVVEQAELLRAAAPNAVLSGVLITHAHMGHMLGLAHFGRESAASDGLAVYVSEAMAVWLKAHAPWSQLVRLGNIRPTIVAPGKPARLSDGLSVAAIRVPHRDEFADTTAWSIIGPARRLLFCPDIDSWGAWETPIDRAVAAHEVSLLDGTFYDEREITGRVDGAKIPHPPVRDTIVRLRDGGHDVRFIHLNHTNPLLDEGRERAAVREAGFGVAVRGDRIPLDGFPASDRRYSTDPSRREE